MCCNFCELKAGCNELNRKEEYTGYLRECFEGKYLELDKEKFETEIQEKDFNKKWYPYFYITNAKKLDKNIVEVKVLIEGSKNKQSKTKAFKVESMRVYRNVRKAMYTFQVKETVYRVGLTEFEHGVGL